jgi:hypothetical protein
MFSAMTLDQLGWKMRCNKCGGRPERYYAAKQGDEPGIYGNGSSYKWSEMYFSIFQAAAWKIRIECTEEQITLRAASIRQRSGVLVLVPPS